MMSNGFLLILTGLHCFSIFTCFDADDCTSYSNRILSNDYNDYKLNVISKEEEIRNFQEAQRICQLCYDGSLLTGNWTKNIPNNYLNWIGVYRGANSSTWTWSNGESIDDWKLYANEFRHRFHNPELEYSVLAYKKNETVVWIAINNAKFQNSGRLLTLMDNIPPREYYDLIVTMPLAATCLIPNYTDCYYWNYTEPRCVWDEQHGCHSYGLTMVQPPDNSSVHCPTPTVHRFAFQCNDTQCLHCRVGEWSAWSECSVKLCRDGDGLKIRSRKMLDKNCPEELYYVNLKQTATCSIVGCDLLRNQTLLDDS